MQLYDCLVSLSISFTDHLRFIGISSLDRECSERPKLVASAVVRLLGIGAFWSPFFLQALIVFMYWTHLLTFAAANSYEHTTTS
jgi:hypothetical protein